MEFSTVLEHLGTHFGVEGALSALGSCEDLNFKLKLTATPSNPSFSVGKYVVKYIRNGSDDTIEKHIKVQHHVMRHLQSVNLSYKCPLPMTCVGNEETTVRIHSNGIDYIMHVLSYQDGDLLSNQKYFSPHLLESFGEMVAVLSDAMSTSQVTTDRKTQWDMQTAYELIQSYASSVEDVHRREKMLAMSKEMNDIIQSHRDHLRVQLVHADLAPYNVLVSSTKRIDGQPVLDAIIDFGDVSESWLVAEIAIALSPLLVPPECDILRNGFSDDHHPLRTTLMVLRGFLKKTPLNRNEAMALWPLIVLRATLLNLAIAKLIETDKDNAYLLNEIVENEKLVEAVLAVPAASAIAAILETCGFPTADVVTNSLPAPLKISDASTVSTLDLACLSNAYKYSGEWNEERNLFSYLGRHEDTAKSAPVEVTRVGLPWLIRCRRNTPEAPKSYPTFTALAKSSVSSALTLSLTQGSRVICDRLLTKDESFYKEVLLAITDSTADASLPTIQETICVTDNGDFAVRVISISSDPVHSFTSSRGRCYAAEETLDLRWECASLVLVQVLQLKSYAFTTLLDHQDLYQPLHFGAPSPLEDEGQHWFPPLFVTHFDWQYLWRRLSVDPLHSTTTSVGEVEANSTWMSDEYETMRDEAMFARNEYLGALQEHYYDIDKLSLLPPLILRGDRAHLLSHTGRPLLDMVNNVAVLGHSHPAVFDAATKQLSLLNTNSRFVYPGLGAFAKEIVETTIPEHARHQLNRVVFVNSGSEATDLALRIARTVVSHRRWHARRQAALQGQEQEQEQKDAGRVAFRWFRDVICMRGGYHGVTTASDEVSTTLNDNPLALETRPDHVHLAPMPNFFRGLYTLDDAAATGIQVDPTPEEEELLAAKYAEHVEKMVQDMIAVDRAPTAFIAEPLSGNAGGVRLPKSYLHRVYSLLRQPAVGGLCICDEVQTGYGRLGQGFWGFQSTEHDTLLPDIITVAKAAGNGHPLGYIVTSQAILDEFYAAQGSFFSSAGGGPVSCAIGRAVLRTVQAEQRLTHAQEVGELLSVGLRALQRKHPHIIGYIHGYGLYQGVEIIAWDQGTDGQGKKAGTREARLICRRLLDLGIICHNTGDYSNVLKVKPPLCFSRDDANYFMAMLDKVCTEGW